MKEKKFILGIDPGLSGALTVLNPQTNLIEYVTDIPTVPSPFIKGRKEIDVQKLSLELGIYIDEVAFAVFEQVHAAPNDGPVQAFSFGKSTGILVGLLGAHFVPVTFTPPAVWKNVMGLSRDKNHSREMAMVKFPASAELFKRKKDDGRAESALLAYFGKRFLR